MSILVTDCLSCFCLKHCYLLIFSFQDHFQLFSNSHWIFKIIFCLCFHFSSEKTKIKGEMLGFWKIFLSVGTILASFDLITADNLLFITRGQKFCIVLMPQSSCWSFSPTQSGVICSPSPDNSDSKESPWNIGDQSSILESGRSSREGSVSIQFSHSVMSDSLWPHWLRQARPPCPSPTPGTYSNSCPLSRWYHLTISSSVIPFSSCPQSFPASGSFQMSQLFTTGGQSIRVSASKSVLPMNIQDWSPLGWTGWISLQSKGLSRVFSNTTFQKHQLFGVQLSL